MDTISTRALALDRLERAFCFVLFVRMALVFAPSLPAHPINIMPVMSEGLALAFLLLRKPTTAITTSRWAWAIALASSAMPLLAKPVGASAHAIAPVWLIASLFLFGTTFAVWGKCALNVRFGVAAANRGVVVGGPYVFLRHPIYTGYFICFVGSLLANPSAWNAGLYLASACLLVVRINIEEQFLKRDPAYVEFMRRVPYRLAPGLY